jgi:hypothetical protein
MMLTDWVSNNCRFAASMNRNPPVKGQMISIPGDRATYILVEEVDQGTYANGGRWWQASGTDSDGNPRRFGAEDEIIKNKGWTTYSGPKSDFHRKRDEQRAQEAEQRKQRGLADEFGKAFPFKPRQLLTVKPEASEHQMLGAFVDNHVRVDSVDYSGKVVTVSVVGMDDMRVAVPAAELAKYTEPALPPSAANVRVRTPRGVMTLEGMVDEMPTLAEYVRGGNVEAIASAVYPNANKGRGFESFLGDMGRLGVPDGSMKEGVHYRINNTADPLAYLTGEVILRPVGGRIPDSVLEEIRPMLVERDSDLRPGRDGSVYIYNNPLFRAVVALGVWN